MVLGKYLFLEPHIHFYGCQKMAILGGPNQNVRIGAKMRNNFLNEGFPKRGGVQQKQNFANSHSISHKINEI